MRTASTALGRGPDGGLLVPCGGGGTGTAALMTGHSRATEEVQTALHRLLGDAGLASGDQARASYCVDRRSEFGAPALAVARPKTADQVAAMVRLCAQRSIAIVPLGGDTSLAGGAVPIAGLARIVPDLSRMNAIRSVDPIGMTMTYKQPARLELMQTIKQALEPHAILNPGKILG